MQPHLRAGDGRPSLGAVLIGTFVIMLDTGAVYVVAPSVRHDLGADRAIAGWLVMGYSVAYALLLGPGERLGRRFGRETVLLVSLGGFAAASALCGTAGSPHALVGWRVLQGATAGVMNPQILGLLSVASRNRVPVTALVVYQVTSGVTVALGPLLAGALIAWDPAGAGWRAVFLVNVPVVAVLLLAVAAGRRRVRSWPVLPRGDPASPAAVRDRRAVIGAALDFWHFGAVAAVWYVVASRLRWDEGQSALVAGIGLLPLSAAPVLASVVIGCSPARGSGRRALWAGAGLTAAGVAGAAAVLADGGATGWVLVPSLLAVGAGSGLLSAAVADLVLACRSWRDATRADRMLNVSQRLGAVGGVAVAALAPVGLGAYGALGLVVPLLLLAAMVPDVHRPRP